MRAFLPLLAALVLASCGPGGRDGEWTAPNGDLAGTRSASGSKIDAANVGSLELAWRFRYPAPAGFSGIAASTPLVADGVVYVQDLHSNVYALDAESGRRLWARDFDVENGGPNGLALAEGRVFGNTTESTFALDPGSGRVLWGLDLGAPPGTPITIAPAVADDLVFTSTTAQRPGARGELVALDASSGAVAWRFDTIEEPWRFPDAFGGGAWQTPTVDEDGRVYWGIANPNPWGGTDQRPNGGSYPGPARYTSSLLVLEGQSGRLAWFDQVTPHYIRDYDFQNPPVLAGDLVVGAGKAGRVLAWNRESEERVWKRTSAFTGTTGSVAPETRLRLPWLPGRCRDTPRRRGRPSLRSGRRPLLPREQPGSGELGFYRVDPANGKGRFSALDLETGKPLWERRLPQPVFGCATVSNDVVFTSTYDGRLYGFDTETGETVWEARAPAGVNAYPAVAGDLLLVQAGTDHPSFGALPAIALVAYRLA